MKKIAIFTSGQSRGSNFLAIYDYIKSHDLDISIDYLLVTDTTAPIVVKAVDLGIKIVVYDTAEKINNFLINTCTENPVDLIVLAGFMRKLNHVFFQNIKTPIVNIHPALLPKYGGKGMYGMNVHHAVFCGGEKISGATVHYVNESYDEGDIILQKECDISFCSSAEEIARAVLQIEHEIYPRIIAELVSNPKQY